MTSLQETQRTAPLHGSTGHTTKPLGTRDNMVLDLTYSPILKWNGEEEMKPKKHSNI